MPDRSTLQTAMALLAGLLLTATLVACTSGLTLPVAAGDPNKPPPEAPSPEDPEPEPPRFSVDILPILTSTCAFNGCHGPLVANLDLVMTAEAAYGNLVNIPSGEVPALMRVSPGDPDNSYIIQKLDGTAEVGDQMPLDGPYLPPETLRLFRDWIAAGALND